MTAHLSDALIQHGPSALNSTFQWMDLTCSSMVVNSTKQTAITETSTSGPLFEDISMDGEMGQSTTTSRSGQDVVVELGSLSDSGGLKTDAQGGSKVLQTCFTGVLSPGGHCRQSNALQESTTSAHYIVGVPILPQLPRRKNLQMGNNQSVYIAPREVSLVRRARNASVGGKLKRWNTLGWSVLQ